MRVRVDVEAEHPSLEWDDVFGPARAVVYDLIRGHDAELATQLHDHGWAGHPLRPLGLSCPQFRGAPRARGRYTTSSNGSVWLGSPVPRIASAMIAGLAGRHHFRWGKTPLRIKGVQLETAPRDGASSGRARLATATPVLVKHEGKFINSEHPSFAEMLRRNILHKADVLGLPPQADLEIHRTGPERRFRVQDKPRIGATLDVTITADPRLLEALQAWGLGLANNQGFGWTR